MILLQMGGGVYAGAGANPNIIIYFLAGILIVVALLLIGAMISRLRTPRTAEEIQRRSGASFRRGAKAMGLPGPHIDMLENLVRLCKVKQPFLVFSNAGLLDDTLKKGLYSIENARDLTLEEREHRKAIIFQIKQLIESNARKGASLSSTTFLRPGQPVSVTPEGGQAFSSKVISNMKDFLTVAAPLAPAGVSTRWMRGTKLAVYLWRDNDAGYSFPSKVLGYDTVKGISSVLIQHSKTLRREQRRRSKRRELMRACFYYPIRIVEAEEGRRGERKASVEQNMRTLGTVVDLSAGGCAIQTLNPFDKGTLVMIEFDIDKKAPVRAFGKVMHVNRQKGRGGAMHVMFTRVTRQHLNRISEFVYDFSRPTTLGQVRQQMDRTIPGRSDARPLPR
jgi:c-di-GMP-binding flagellar brake protein YcgR